MAVALDGKSGLQTTVHVLNMPISAAYCPLNKELTGIFGQDSSNSSWYTGFYYKGENNEKVCIGSFITAKPRSLKDCFDDELLHVGVDISDVIGHINNRLTMISSSANPDSNEVRNRKSTLLRESVDFLHELQNGGATAIELARAWREIDGNVTIDRLDFNFEYFTSLFPNEAFPISDGKVRLRNDYILSDHFPEGRSVPVKGGFHNWLSSHFPNLRITLNRATQWNVKVINTPSSASSHTAAEEIVDQVLQELKNQTTRPASITAREHALSIMNLFAARAESYKKQKKQELVNTYCQHVAKIGKGVGDNVIQEISSIIGTLQNSKNIKTEMRYRLSIIALAQDYRGQLLQPQLDIIDKAMEEIATVQYNLPLMSALNALKSVLQSNVSNEGVIPSLCNVFNEWEGCQKVRGNAELPKAQIDSMFLKLLDRLDSAASEPKWVIIFVDGAYRLCQMNLNNIPENIMKIFNNIKDKLISRNAREIDLLLHQSPRNEELLQSLLNFHFYNLYAELILPSDDPALQKVNEIKNGTVLNNAPSSTPISSQAAKKI